MESSMMSNTIDINAPGDGGDGDQKRDGRFKNSGKGKKKITIEKIEKKEQRMVTFSKRRKGLFNKCREFCSMTGTDIAAIVSSPAGQVFAYGSPSVGVVIDRYLQSGRVGNGADELGFGNRMLAGDLKEVIEENDDEDEGKELGELLMKKEKLEKMKKDMVEMIMGMGI